MVGDECEEGFVVWIDVLRVSLKRSHYPRAHISQVRVLGRHLFALLERLAERKFVVRVHPPPDGACVLSYMLQRRCLWNGDDWTLDD